MIFKTLAAGSPSAGGMMAVSANAQIHCPLCGSQLYRPVDQLCVRCACGEIMVTPYDVEFKTELQVALIKATQKAIDRVCVVANDPNLKPVMFSTPEPDIEVVPPYPKTEHPGYFYFSESPNITIKNMKPFQWQHYETSIVYGVDPATTTKVKKETVELDGLTPALQEFFKDYIE